MTSDTAQTVPASRAPRRARRWPQTLACALALAGLFAAAASGVLRSADRQATTAAPEPRGMTDGGTRRRSEPGPRDVAADLSHIRFKREFRILVTPKARDPGAVSDALARQAEHIRLLEKFADEHFLIPVFVPVERESELARALLDGRGDMIGTALANGPFPIRRPQLTVPVAVRTEYLVGRRGDRILDERDLAGREIAVLPRSGFWRGLAGLRSRVPSLKLRVLDEDTPPVRVLEAVRDLTLDLAVVQVQPGSIGVAPFDQLAIIDGFETVSSLSFGVHPRADELQLALDEFLTRESLALRASERYRADWDEIKRRGLLRVITRNNAATYFIWRGRPVGFEYDLMAKFAREHDLSLQMVVPQGRDLLLPALTTGKGDVVAASMAVSRDRRGNGVEFTRPYKESREIFVTGTERAPIMSPTDLDGRTVSVRRSSISWHELGRLQEAGYELHLEAVPEDLETEEILERVASGIYDVTVADEYSIKVASLWRDDLVATVPLGEPVDVAWAVRESDSELLEKLNAFIDREYRELEYNMLHTRYFGNSEQVRAHVTQRADRILGGALSPYDDLVRWHAARHGFDWPLIVAVMYRESRFDPSATSTAGAQGLMQVLPVTAKRFGISNLKVPENSIAAGVRMLSWLYRQLESRLPVRERIWFTLAAYNAGLGHLHDARRLTEAMGLDPNRWFDNVEHAMLLLSKPEFYRDTRHGYVRGREPVDYVRDIRDLYDAYRSLLRS